MTRSIEIYDTTLRDGAQGEQISFSVEDKKRIALRLDELVHFIEGGWPGSNPKDDQFFKQPPRLRRARLVAFGSTQKPGHAASKDPILKALIRAGTPVVTLFGKSSAFHVTQTLHLSLAQNLDLVFDSIRFLKKHVEQVFFDAEHFFDGFKQNRHYALKVIEAAHQAGADRLILCDTNGGSLPQEIAQAVRAVRGIGKIGIHCHNDGELAVANSLAAVEEGAVQIHGTINGIGERCGNANLISIIPNLVFKMRIPGLGGPQLKKLKEISHFVDELANRVPVRQQPYVGDSAFAHKGGVHIHAVMKNRQSYEHIDPRLVGNRRRILVSDQSGQSSLTEKARQFGLVTNRKQVLKKLLSDLKNLENRGFQFEGAEASFEILMKRALGRHRSYFRLIGFRVIDEKISQSEPPRSEATIQIEVDGKLEHTAAEGVGPVNALDHALRKALERFYPQLKEVQLVDYKVRVLPAASGTASQVRVLIESQDHQGQWQTVGVSDNIIEASWMALVDSLEFKLMKRRRFDRRR